MNHFSGTVKLAAAALVLFAGAHAAQSTASATPFAVLSVYDGEWTVKPVAQSDAPARVDRLINHCTPDEAFYTCEQIVNRKPVALIVFVQGGKPGEFATRVVLPDGTAGGGSRLTVDGQHWTFLSLDHAGKPTFRVENVFSDHNHIHSEQFKAAADGSWTKVGEQLTVRAGSD